MKICVVFLLLTSLNAFGLTMGQAIDEAGRQRMLSQKVAKAYFMKAINAKSSAADHQMHTSIKKFEYNLEQLKAFEPAEKLRPQLELVQRLWGEYKALLQLPVTGASADQVLSLSNQVLKETNEYVKALQKYRVLKLLS